jgi:4-amino-4-deoxy-L-arabinose transferase-like glycosyltransferase
MLFVASAFLLPLAAGAAHLLLVRARARTQQANYQSPLTWWVDQTLYWWFAGSFMALVAAGVVLGRRLELDPLLIGAALSTAWGLLLWRYMNRTYERLTSVLDQRKFK